MSFLNFYRHALFYKWRNLVRIKRSLMENFSAENVELFLDEYDNNIVAYKHSVKENLTFECNDRNTF